MADNVACEAQTVEEKIFDSDSDSDSDNDSDIQYETTGHQSQRELQRFAQRFRQQDCRTAKIRRAIQTKIMPTIWTHYETVGQGRQRIENDSVFRTKSLKLPCQRLMQQQRSKENAAAT